MHLHTKHLWTSLVQRSLVVHRSAEPVASWFNLSTSVHLICKASNQLSPSLVLIFCPFSACCPLVCHCILIAMSWIVTMVTLKRRLWLVSICNLDLFPPFRTLQATSSGKRWQREAEWDAACYSEMNRGVLIPACCLTIVKDRVWQQ